MWSWRYVISSDFNFIAVFYFVFKTNIFGTIIKLFIVVQWLVTMLDSAGFMEPLRNTNKTAPDWQYLSKGRYLVIDRPPTEDQLMKRLPGAISNQVGIYHYATVKCTTFRDNSVEENTMKEKASVVNINNTICKIMYFINAIIGIKIMNLLLASAMEIPRNLTTVCASLYC